MRAVAVLSTSSLRARARALALPAALPVLAALAVVVAPSPAQASHSWNGYHWGRTTSPFTLKVGDNVGPAWDGDLVTAVGDWRTPTGTATKVLDLTQVAGTSNKRCSAVSGTVQVCNSTYGNTGWLGLAQIWLSGGHISQGTAKMNDTYFNTATYNNPNERLHVMCQEVGHTFGLTHTSEDGSSQNTCMDYFSNTGVNATSTLSTHPNTHDYDQLAVGYGHLDSSSTYSASAAAAAAAAADGGDGRADWGREVERSAGGDHSVFERDLGDGRRLLTHVTWAAGRG